MPAEPVPAVTIEVLSPANKRRRGRAELESKRSLFARIGVPLHIEIDPADGFITVWELRGGALVHTRTCAVYSSDAIGDVRLETPEPGICNVLLPGGHNVLGGGDELARAEREEARADRESVRAERLAAKLRDLGIDPDA